MPKRQVIGGGFQSALGVPLDGGTLTFQINTDAVTDTGEQVVAGRLVTADLDENGDIVGTVEIWPNDQLTPTDTLYILKAYRADGLFAWKGTLVLVSGVDPYNLSGEGGGEES